MNLYIYLHVEVKKSGKNRPNYLLFYFLLFCIFIFVSQDDILMKILH